MYIDGYKVYVLYLFYHTHSTLNLNIEFFFCFRFLLQRKNNTALEIVVFC